MTELILARANWLRYQTSHGVLSGLWNKYVGDEARAASLPTVPVTSPYAQQSS